MHENSLSNLSVCDEETNHVRLREQITRVFPQRVTFADDYRKTTHSPMAAFLSVFSLFWKHWLRQLLRNNEWVVVGQSEFTS